MIMTRFTPLKVAIFYGCIGGLWVVATISTMVANLVLERTLFYSIEVKSVVFILLSSLVLYFLITQSKYEGVVSGKEQFARLVRALKAYSECHHALMRATDEEQLMRDICRTFIMVGGYRMAWVGIAADDDEKTITPVAGWGDSTDFISTFKSTCMNRDLGQGPIKTAIRTGKPVVLQHKQANTTCEMCRIRFLQQGFCSSIFLPMSNRGQTFAALMIYSSGEDVFDEEEVTLLTNLVNDLAYGIIALRTDAENKKVEQQRQLLASVMIQMRSGLILIDDHETIQYVNPGAEKILGCSTECLIGNDIHACNYEELDKNFYDKLLSQITSGGTQTVQFQHKRFDGVLLELELITWTVTGDDDVVISHVGMIRDVTHQVQLENQLRRAQRMEAIGILAGGIAHDFNNALASIITCTELALDEVEEGSNLKELLDVVLKSGFRGKNLVRQILTFSRQAEQGRQEVKIDLIVNECLKLLRSTLSPSIEIRLNVGEDLGLVFADPTQMHQVVMNLCTNAVHAIRGHGRGVIELVIENCELDSAMATNFVDLVPGNYLRLVVRDNGHGMEQAVIDRIFDPFFSTKGQAEGTGLGLSVIHGIVSKLGGTIVVESIPGHGSRFEVYLPRAEKNQEAEPSDAKLTIAKPGVERILLVDDDLDLIFSTELMLKQLGYHVVPCTDPSQALQLFSSNPDQFDLVITDQAMPQMNGMELASKLNFIRPDIPIILCTGYDPTSGYGADETGQIVDYITELAIKPLERSEFADTVRRALKPLADRQVHDG